MSHSLRTRKPVSSNPTATFLRPTPKLPDKLDFDTVRRFGLATQLLDRLLVGVTGPAKILDVGCNVLQLLPNYFDPERVRVARCDTFANVSDDPDYHQITPGEPLPFADGAFDAVVSLEVLEHVPAEGRRFFLSECLRVSRRGCVWTCPNGVAEIRRAEAVGSATYALRNGKPHPFLQEHADYGLPTTEEITGHLTSFDIPYAVWQQSPADVWLANLVLGEPLSEKFAPDWVHKQLREVLDRFDRTTPDPRPASYRNIYVAAKVFDATGALEPFETPFGTVARAGSASDGEAETADLLPTVCRAAGVAVADLASNWKKEVKSLEAEVGRHAAERKRWVEDIEAMRRELSAWNQRAYLLTNGIRLLTGTTPWKLAYPFRVLQRWIAPRAFTQRELKPWFELKLSEEGTWQGPGSGPFPVEWESVGIDPQFVLPVVLPPGYVRLKLRMSGISRGLTEVYADEGDGFQTAGCVETFEWEENLSVDVVVKFEKPVFGLRLDPLGGPGKFELHEFSATPLAGPRIFAHALVKKVMLLKMYELTGRTLWNGLKMLCTGRLGRMAGKLTQTFGDDRRLGPSSMAARTSYDVWRRRRALTDTEKARQRTESAAWTNPPTISLLMPVYNPPPDCLEKAILSVRAQTYPHWQLCVCDDKSTDPKVAAILKKQAAADSRITVVFAPQNGGIAKACNLALEQASGEFVGGLDHDDELAEHCLFKVAEAFRTNSQAEYVYTDEDKMTPEGTHVDPFFKPDWSPDFFLSCMYTCHLGIYRTVRVRAIGGYRSDFDTAQDFDMALRYVASIQNEARAGGLPEESRIVHVPDVLYHWRMLPTSTALSARAKPKAEATARRALESYLECVKRPGTVERGSAVGLHRVRYEIRGEPKVSIVIPSAGRRAAVRGRDTWFVLNCVESIRRESTYANYEIVVVDNDDMAPQLQRELDELGVRRVPYTEPFNLSHKMNLGAAKAEGDYLLLLNDDTEIITPDWIESMLELGQWPEVGAVGAKLLFEDGRLQHAGVTLIGRVPLHHFYAAPGDYPGYWHGNLLVRNYSAVTGACVLVRTDDYHSVGGFDPEFPLNYNDIDLCLKLRQKGKRIVYQPHAMLYHFEGVSKEGTFKVEVDKFVARWGETMKRDPYYNPNLTQVHGDYRLGAGEPG
ncbi:MAG TPA: glycosyltransferase [Fimbriiglobus sp.]|jgi:GT2 family glycosyltransferase/SAM-dependent methyltransferase